MSNLPSGYEPRTFESRLYAEWEASGCFTPRGEGKPYSILPPPPTASHPDRPDASVVLPTADQDSPHGAQVHPPLRLRTQDLRIAAVRRVGGQRLLHPAWRGQAVLDPAAAAQRHQHPAHGPRLP